MMSEVGRDASNPVVFYTLSSSSKSASRASPIRQQLAVSRRHHPWAIDERKKGASSQTIDPEITCSTVLKFHTVWPPAALSFLGRALSDGIMHARHGLRNVRRTPTRTPARVAVKGDAVGGKACPSQEHFGAQHLLLITLNIERFLWCCQSYCQNKEKNQFL